MAHVKLNAVHQIATGTGTGALTLGSAISARYRTLTGAGMSNGDTTYVRIQHASIAAEWEISLATLSSGTITRTFDSKSASATGSAINFSAGDKIVSSVMAAGDMVTEDANGDITVTRDITAGRNLIAAAALLVAATTTAPAYAARLDTDTQARISVGLTAADVASIQAGPGGSTARDTFLERAAAANWRLGAADAASPVAQTLSVQNVATGTSNTAGAAWTLKGSGSTGAGAGGAIQFQTSPAGSSGSSQNSYATALLINGDGRLALGSGTVVAAASVAVNKDITGATTAFGLYSAGTIQSGVTTSASYYRTAAATAAASFTLTHLRHFFAVQGTLGSGSTVTNQYGFAVDSTLTGGTNNYAFHGNLAAASGAWNLFMNGTANNYMAGALGIGTQLLTGYGLRNFVSLTGATTARAQRNEGVAQSDVTASAIYYDALPTVAAASFTLTSLISFRANQGTIGAGATVTNQYGFLAESTLTGATNNYGFYSNIASGSNRWNFFANGTANNAYAGNSRFGGTTAPTEAVHVTGNIALSGYIAGAEQSAPSAPASDGYRIFAQDNGAGKTQLMVLFASGAAQQLAIQP